MRIVRQATLNKFNQKVERLGADLNDAIDSAEKLRSERNAARLALDGLRRTVRVSNTVDKKLQEYEAGIVVGNYEAQVVAELVAEGKEKIINDLKEGLRNQKREELLEHLRVTAGPTIREELDKLFQTDGTYVDLEEDVKSEVRRGIAADLRAEIEAQLKAEQDDPAIKAAYMASIAAEAAEEPEVTQHAEVYRQALEEEWRDEAIQLAHTAAEHKVLAGKGAVIARVTEEYVNSRRGGEALKKVTKTTEQKITELTIEELLEESGDDAHRTILEERRALEAATLASQNYAEKLALDFTNGGIDSEKIEQGTVVQLFLGKISTGEIKKKDVYGHNQDVSVPMLYCKRMITVTSMGNGMFKVDRDTLTDSTNAYAQQHGLTEGSVIAVGMLVRGVEGDTPKDKLLPLLKAGATLQYDTDTTTPEFTNTHLPIADVKISGVSARKYEATKEQYL